MRLLESDIARPWTLTDLAEELHLAPAYLVRLFKDATGLPPKAYLAQVRAERAAVLLLHSDDPVTSIGRAVGWPDQNYFARRFKAHYGLSATTYRKRFAAWAAAHPPGVLVTRGTPSRETARLPARPLPRRGVTGRGVAAQARRRPGCARSRARRPRRESRGGAEGAGLDQDVAERGGLGRPGDDRQAGRVGGELAQQLVAGPAADDVHHVRVPPGQLPARRSVPAGRRWPGCRGCTG